MNFADIDTPVSDEELNGPEDVGIAEIGEKPVIDEAVDDPEANDQADEAPEVKAPVVEPAVAETPQDRSPVIPRSRFDEVNTKLHAEREENERLRAQLASAAKGDASQSSQVDIDALEQQVFDAMMAGDKDTAVALRSQINTELRSQAEQAATSRITQQMSEREARAAEVAEQAQVSTVVSTLVSVYPFLDTESPQMNQKAIDEVVGWREVYRMQGRPMAEALQMAVDMVAPMYATTETKAPPVDTRKAAALARNAIDAAAQPPAQVAGVGNRAAPPKPKIDTQKDWETLTESERNELLS